MKRELGIRHQVSASSSEKHVLKVAMTSRAITVSIAGACILLTAMMANAVDKKGTIDELKARIKATSKEKDRIELAVEIVERQYEAADKAYNAGSTDEGQKEISDVAEFGVMAANESAHSGDRMKQTEIALRKIEDRLDNLAKSVDLDYRPPVREAFNQIEKARNALLLRMFK